MDAVQKELVGVKKKLEVSDRRYRATLGESKSSRGRRAQSQERRVGALYTPVRRAQLAQTPDGTRRCGDEHCNRGRAVEVPDGYEKASRAEEKQVGVEAERRKTNALMSALEGLQEELQQAKQRADTSAAQLVVVRDMLHRETETREKVEAERYVFIFWL